MGAATGAGVATGAAATGAPLRRRCTRAANSPSPRMLKNVPTASEILPRKDTFESVIKWLLRGSVTGRAVLGRCRREPASPRVIGLRTSMCEGAIDWPGGPDWARPNGPHPVFYLSGAAASAKGRNGVPRRVVSRGARSLRRKWQCYRDRAHIRGIDAVLN